MSKNVKAPYCKVCHDAGKPENEYKNHWVKDLTGKTTCPTLLNTECRYCHNRGHTAKFCELLIKNNKDKERTSRKPQHVVVEKPKEVKKAPINQFAGLEYDSDEEASPEPKKEIKPPSLSGWAAIAAKPKPEIAKEPAGLAPGMIVLTKTTKIAQITEPTPKPERKPAPWAKLADHTKKNSWADLSDSDDDEETAYNRDANDYAYKIGKYALPEEWETYNDEDDLDVLDSCDFN